MMKIVVKLGYRDEKEKQKALMAASSLRGITSVAIDGKDKKITLVGEVDPIAVVSKLRKVCCAKIDTVGPPEEKKKEEQKKDDQKKDEPKKDEKEVKNVDEYAKQMVKAYEAYNPHLTTYYAVYSAEENPNACIIC